MIPADVLNSLKALALTQKPLIQATPATAPTAAFEAGQKYQATVQAQLAPGIFKVQVADQVLQLQLPNTIRSGDTITLQVVSLLPRLTFNMAASSNPLSTSDQLSSTARLLSSLTQQPLEKSFVRPTNSAPLWGDITQAPEAGELAGKLQTALSQSGLFYESHQAQWLSGSRNTAQLLQEPQNQPIDMARAAAGHHEKSQRMATGPITDPGQVTSALPTERNHISGIPEHLHPLVQQQLNALENRQVQWQGPIWQNQEMNWKINEESSRAPNGEESKLWSTQIQLNLPNMGEVTATLRLANHGLSITLEADSDKTRAQLGAASSTLVSALSDRGITTSSLVTQRHDNT